MKATELRIGNWVNNFAATGPLQVKVHMIETLEITQERSPNEYLMPIPLTDEWLYRFGLTEYSIEGPFKFEFKGVEYVIEEQEEWYFIGVNHIDNVSYFVWHIKYVHQLQNLYFALTGEELGVKGE